MAKIEAPIKIDGFKCVEDMAQAVLNYTYKGKTLKEWADSISEPQTNADRIRTMTNEELAEWLAAYNERSSVCPNFGAYSCQASCTQCWLDWLKREVKDERTD